MWCTYRIVIYSHLHVREQQTQGGMRKKNHFEMNITTGWRRNTWKRFATQTHTDISKMYM